MDCSGVATCESVCWPRSRGDVDGALLRDLAIQAPVVVILLVIMWLDRRDHKKAIKAMQRRNAQLQTALIDHMNRRARMNPTLASS